METNPSSRSVVLLVEDEPLVRAVLVDELHDAGYVVLEARSADEAMRYLEGDGKIDILFTDIRLPGPLDGWQLTEKARKLRPNLPVIYATGYTGEGPRLVQHSLFLRKPYRPSTVIDAIVRLLESEAGRESPPLR